MTLIIIILAGMAKFVFMAHSSPSNDDDSHSELLSPAYILATAPVYDPTELSRVNRVATVHRSLSRLHHVHCHDPIHT